MRHFRCFLCLRCSALQLTSESLCWPRKKDVWGLTVHYLRNLGYLCQLFTPLKSEDSDIEWHRGWTDGSKVTFAVIAAIINKCIGEGKPEAIGRLLCVISTNFTSQWGVSAQVSRPPSPGSILSAVLSLSSSGVEAGGTICTSSVSSELTAQMSYFPVYSELSTLNCSLDYLFSFFPTFKIKLGEAVQQVEKYC